MPLFEYQCQDCDRHFEAFVTKDRAPQCPACHSRRLQKLLSSPGMVGAAGRRESESFPACQSQGGSCACRHSIN